ncbi:MAG: DUF1761 domain-containing protein [Pseudomonadales bacterium]|nr:DUF1761 domain-containing protein [Pseudomonadales bacterium]
MDAGSAISGLNWIAIMLATVSAFMVGGVWYGPLFGKAWMDSFGFTEEYLAERNIGLVFGLSFLLSFIAAFNLAMFIPPDAELGFGIFAGLAAGLGWVATFLGILYLFEKRSLKSFAINGGYCVVALGLMGAILGAM